MTKTQSLGMNMIKICSNAHLKHIHLKLSLLLFLSATRTVNTVKLLNKHAIAISLYHHLNNYIYAPKQMPL